MTCDVKSYTKKYINLLKNDLGLEQIFKTIRKKESNLCTDISLDEIVYAIFFSYSGGGIFIYLTVIKNVFKGCSSRKASSNPPVSSSFIR